MFFKINGLSVSNLQKATDDEALVNVDIVANHLTEDSDGETVLKEAFSEDVVNTFLDVGVIDFFHDSRNTNLSKEDRMKAIIGKPIGFRWENGEPVVTAQLTKSHPIVQDMLPHLEAKQPVYAASIGGSKMVLETKDSRGQKHRVIPKIKWDHLAIAPAPYVVNRGGGMNVSLLQKANEPSSLMCEFDSMSAFQSNVSNIVEQEETLMKALAAPSSAGDLYETPGGVVTKQSIEKTPINLTLSDQDGIDLIDTIIELKKGNVPETKDGYMKHFESKNKKDFGQKSYDLINKYFKLKRSR